MLQSESEPSKPQLLSVEPQLFVFDIVRSCHFFETALGFTTRFTYGEPPFYAQVCRDGVSLNLRVTDKPVIDPAVQLRDNLLSASITCSDARQLFVEFQAAGAQVHQALRTEPWGARTFIVKDPDGNLILFAG